MQLRALGLLSLFRFNMTYMVKGPTDEPGPKSCSTIECRLLGHCFAKHDYKDFYCDCFEGYSGADCGVGPLCPKTPNMCKNGGTCGKMGPAAVSCICAPGFTGDLCEAQIEAPECGIEECAEGCKAGPCDCKSKALTVNQRQEVWESSEFILSCMAYGSPDIIFTWFKDGVKVSFNGTTRDIWTRTVAEDALGRRVSVLGISETKTPDSGRWSCSAYDAGRKRCSALRLSILQPPDIRLVPSTITVHKM